MDLTELFLGDALEGIDLGGLAKLGFRATEGFDDDSENDSRPERQEVEDEETDAQIEQSMPPTLYKLPDGRQVYELSSMFIPDKNGPARHIREQMLMFNHAIINAGVARPRTQ